MSRKKRKKGRKNEEEKKDTIFLLFSKRKFSSIFSLFFIFLAKYFENIYGMI